MKKLLFILCLGCAATLSSAQEQNDQQSLQDSHHKIIGYIRGGKLTDAGNNFLGSFNSSAEGRTIADKNNAVLGYLVDGREIQDASHKTLGFIEGSRGSVVCTILDAQRQPLGYINIENGAVQDNRHSIIGYEINTEVMWAAPYFFFFKF